MNFKKIVALGLAILMSASPLVYAETSEGYALPTEAESLAQYDETFLEENQNSYLNYEKLMSSYENGEGNYVYPNYYGGAYIDGNGQLVIYVKNGSEGSNELNNILGSEDYTVKQANYSYNELNETMEILNNFKINNSENEVAMNYNEWFLNDQGNNVVVKLEVFNDEKIEEFRQSISDSEIIEFEESTSDVNYEYDLEPGRELFYFIDSDTMSIFSMGYRARKNGVDGFVTAAHGIPMNGTVSGYSSDIGTVTAWQRSGKVDACFVQTVSQHSPSNTLYGTSNVLSTTISSPGAGTVINKIGAITGATSGTVISTNASFSAEGVTLTNLTSANYTSTNGDSGGIVYSYIAASNTRYTLGIHCGASGSTRYYIKAGNINSALGCSRY